MPFALQLKLPACKECLQITRLLWQGLEVSGVKPTSLSGRWYCGNQSISSDRELFADQRNIQIEKCRAAK
jgi:hypothetical protein